MGSLLMMQTTRVRLSQLDHRMTGETSPACHPRHRHGHRGNTTRTPPDLSLSSKARCSLPMRHLQWCGIDIKTAP